MATFIIGFLQVASRNYIIAPIALGHLVEKVCNTGFACVGVAAHRLEEQFIVMIRLNLFLDFLCV
ncbi:hypothetical protein D0B88_11150 [Cellvibrio sp. KY-YJ-3]|nr:hypothetical protein D0B88_11150 [Cellvibrio sp. KY-YJ-3]